MSLVEATDLSKRFGDSLAVDAVSFEVGAGEVLGLLGPNGAGKTTTMSMLAGLVKPDSGSVFINGRRFDAQNLEDRILLGIVPQDLAIYPDLTAFENLCFFGQLYRLQGSKLEQRIASALEQTGLNSNAHKLTKNFSGGMKRRLNFAVALLHDPRLLILDEPTVGVDPQSRAHLLETVRRLRDGGMGVVYASHYMDEVEAVCDRVTIIDRGRMVTCGRLTDLLGQLKVHLRLRIAKVTPEIATRIGEALGTEVSCEFDHGEDRNIAHEPTIIIKTQLESESSSLSRLLQGAINVLDGCGIELRGVDTHESNLERLFLQLTGHSLRD